MKIEWTNDLSVGVDQIDRQHQQFLSILNDLLNAVENNLGKEVIANILEQTAAYADYHFATEEKYFEMFHYSGAKKHKEIHRQMRKDITKLIKKAKAKNNDPKVVTEAVDFMNNWLVDHLKIEDHKYANCFIDNGLI